MKFKTKDKSQLNQNLKDISYKTNFVPGTKIAGLFMFSDSSLPKELCITSDIIFWEEEIIQTIELISAGFSILYPTGKIPICHYYFQETKVIGQRDGLKLTIDQVYKTEDTLYSYINKNFLNYMENPNNQDKIKIFEDYAGVKLLDSKIVDNDCPKNFININYLK